MRIARLGREEASAFQQRHLQAHQIAHERTGRTVAGTGVGRAAGSAAVAEVVGRIVQLPRRSNRLRRSMRAIRIARRLHDNGCTSQAGG
jgi:hypothetical protein